MNFLISLIYLVSAISCVALGHADKSVAKCTKQLESIIYIPDNFYKTYLFKILDELVDTLNKFNAITSTAIAPIMKEFAQGYGVTIISQPALGRRTTFTADNAVPNVVRIFGQIVAPPYLNLKGFNYDSNLHIYQASIALTGKEGAVTTLIIIKSVASSA